MTPEQEADQLIDKFMPYAHSSNEHGQLMHSVHMNSARQCAMVCANELLNAASGGVVHVGRSGLTDVEYYQTVLNILKKRK